MCVKYNKIVANYIVDIYKFKSLAINYLFLSQMAGNTEKV